MVAAAKIRRANERVEASTPYANSMVEMLANVAMRVGGSENALLRTHDEVKNVLIIAIVSDRGLAGGFNTNALHQMERLMHEKQAAGASVEVIACGKKAIGYLTYRHVNPSLSFANLSADPTMDEAAQISAYAIDGYAKGTIDEVYLVYNHAKNAAEQQLRQQIVLPVDTSVLDKNTKAVEADETRLEGDTIFEPSAEAVLDHLLPSYVRTTIYQALIDSAAAEQGARRNAMMSATDNATEMVETLTRLYNRVRQGAITTEISEIVGGAAALEE